MGAANRIARLLLPPLVFWALGLLLFGGLAGGKLSAQKHAFNVRDSIEMVRFSDPSDIVPGATAKYSPDAKYFACTTTRGLFDSNRVESTIWVFSTFEAKKYLESGGVSTKPQPMRIA